MASAWGSSWGSAWGSAWGGVAVVTPPPVVVPAVGAALRVTVPAPVGARFVVSVVHIWNLALSHVASGAEVQDEDENTAEANACRRFYDQAREEVLADFAWPFATVTAPLALVTTDPTTEWGYSYRYPGDALTFHRIIGTDRNPTHATRIHYRIERDGQGQVIYTDLVDAVGEYTIGLDDPTAFPAQFVEALAFLLASYIAPRVTGGDPYQLGGRALKMYQWAIGRAQVSAANEEEPDELPDSEFISSRN